MQDNHGPIWRVELEGVKEDVAELGIIVKELAIARMADREVLIELKIWMRLVAGIWGIIALVIAGVAVKLIIGG